MARRPIVRSCYQHGTQLLRCDTRISSMEHLWAPLLLLYNKPYREYMSIYRPPTRPRRNTVVIVTTCTDPRHDTVAYIIYWEAPLNAARCTGSMTYQERLLNGTRRLQNLPECYCMTPPLPVQPYTQVDHRRHMFWLLNPTVRERTETPTQPKQDMHTRTKTQKLNK